MGSLEGRGAGKIPPNADMEGLLKRLLNVSQPARKLEFQQLTEALQTGGVGARIPIIQRAVEAAMGAAGQSETLGRERTARAGLAGSPFDVASQIGTHTANTANIAGIGPSIASQLIAQGPNMVNAATSQAINLGQMDLGRQEFNSNQIGRFYEDLKQSLEFTGSAAAGGGGAGAEGGGGTNSPTTIDYASTGQGNPATFNPSGAQFQE